MRQGIIDGLKPDKLFPLSKWADKYRVLNQKSAAEAGRWRTARTPYLREILDCLSPLSPVETVDWQKGSQVGATESGNNWVGYVIHQAPGPMMVIQPTIDMGKRWSRQRFAPMIEDMPVLGERISTLRSRDSANTTLLKEFYGGIIVVAGANSAAALRSMPVRYLFLDEIDGYPRDVDGEGDPVDLVMERTKTFSRRKILKTSTPTTKGFSRIEDGFLAGDQRYYHVPCPDCGKKQPLKWANIIFKKDQTGKEVVPNSVKYACEHCGVLIEEHNKTKMLAGGKWIASNPKTDDVHRSYHLNSLYSPLGWESWEQIAQKFLNAKDDVEKLKTWTNHSMAETWEEEGDKVDIDLLIARAEPYKLRTLPDDALLAIVGVDVQGNRLELVAWGFGPNEESWVMDYHIIYGNPGQAKVWQELDEYLLTPLSHISGHPIKITACGIDTGGHHTNQVYKFCRERAHRRVIAVKGSSQHGKPIIGRPSKQEVDINGKIIKDGINLWLIGTDTAKAALYGRLRLSEPGAGFVHFSRELPEEFYRQLTSHRLITRYRKGHPVLEWVKKSTDRDEVLDCTIYALATLYHLGVHRWTERDWAKLELQVAPPTADLFAKTNEEDAKQQSPDFARGRKSGHKRRKAGGFATNW